MENSLFYKNIRYIFYHCLDLEHFDMLELNYKVGKPILYAYPLEQTVGNSYSILFFPDDDNAHRFVEYGIDLIGEPHWLDQLENYDINGVMLSDVPSNCTITELKPVGFGRYAEDKTLSREFSDKIFDLLYRYSLRINYYYDQPRDEFGIREFDSFHYKYIAFIRYDMVKDTVFCHKYKNRSTGESEYFTPLKVDDHRKAAYLVFPGEQYMIKFFENFKEYLNNPSKRANLDAILIEIYFDNPQMDFNVTPLGEAVRLSQERINQSVRGLLDLLRRRRWN